jgi:chromosome segregation ATPase
MSVEENMAVLREQLTQAEARGRELINQFVANRRKTHDAYARMDPHSQFTSDMKELLDKALRDLEEFEARLASLHEERTRLMAAANDAATDASLGMTEKGDQL